MSSGSESSLGSILKIAGLVGVIVPLIVAYIEYRGAIQRDIDKNFNLLVEKLSSDKKEERVAAATNLGSYIRKQGDYYDEAVDILTNAVAINHEYSILYAIRRSLAQVKPEDYRTVIQNLLNIDRSMFGYDNTYLRIQRIAELDSISIGKIKTTADELKIQMKVIPTFIVSFLNISRNFPIDSLDISQNSFNSLVLWNIIIQNSLIENSAISSCDIRNLRFNNLHIYNTTFAYSRFNDCTFDGSTIEASLFNGLLSFAGVSFNSATLKDVYFTGANLAGADFRGAKGLEPIYFYRAYNLEQAKFDPEFEDRLRTSLEYFDKAGDSVFLDSVEASSLTGQSLRDLEDYIYSGLPY